MKNIFNRIWICIASVFVMLVICFSIALFYTVTFIRRIFFGRIISNAHKHDLEEPEEVIGSATSQANAIQATLEQKAKLENT